MGSLLIRMLIPLSLVFILSGCTETVYVPYRYISDGVFLCEGKVYENGTYRTAHQTDRPALQYVVAPSEGIELYPVDLVNYEGSLYSLSNYRKALLDAGYIIERESRTPDYLDTVLSKEDDKVRLIYQASGTIRLMFKNQWGPAHILLEGLRWSQ